MEDEDDTVRRWRRVEEEDAGSEGASIATGVDEQKRHTPRRTTRGRRRRMGDDEAQATASRITRRDVLQRAAAEATRERLRTGAGQNDDERTMSEMTETEQRARRGRKRRADGEENSEATRRRGRKSIKIRAVTACQLERIRGGLGEPFGDG